MNKYLNKYVLGILGGVAVLGTATTLTVQTNLVPTVTIDIPAKLSYSSFPQAYNIVGTVSHGSPSNVSAVKDLTLAINGVQQSSNKNSFQRQYLEHGHI